MATDVAGEAGTEPAQEAESEPDPAAGQLAPAEWAGGSDPAEGQGGGDEPLAKVARLENGDLPRVPAEGGGTPLTPDRQEQPEGGAAPELPAAPDQGGPSGDGAAQLAEAEEETNGGQEPQALPDHLEPCWADENGKRDSETVQASDSGAEQSAEY